GTRAGRLERRGGDARPRAAGGRGRAPRPGRGDPVVLRGPREPPGGGGALSPRLGGDARRCPGGGGATAVAPAREGGPGAVGARGPDDDRAARRGAGRMVGALPPARRAGERARAAAAGGPRRARRGRGARRGRPR